MLVWLFLIKKNMHHKVSNIIEQSIPFNFNRLTESLSVKARLYEGKAMFAAIFIDGEMPSQLIQLGIDNINGKTFVEKTSIKNWEQRQGGDYYSSKKPIDLENTMDIKLKFSALTALADNLSGEVVFYIDQCNK